MKFKNLKYALSDESGFSLLELIIAVTLLIIIASGFAAASLGSTVAVKNNIDRHYTRSRDVGKIDSEIDEKYKFFDGTKDGHVDVSGLDKMYITTPTGSVTGYVKTGDLGTAFSAYVQSDPVS